MSIPKDPSPLFSSTLIDDVLTMRVSSVLDPVPQFPMVRVVMNHTGHEIGVVRVFARIHLHTLPNYSQSVGAATYDAGEVAIAIFRLSDMDLIGGAVIDNRPDTYLTSAEVERNYAPDFFKLGADDGFLISCFAFADIEKHIRAGFFAAIAYKRSTNGD